MTGIQVIGVFIGIDLIVLVVVNLDFRYQLAVFIVDLMSEISSLS